MGSFANSMFSGLLGWFRDAVDWVWNVMFNAEDGGLIGWIGENWLWLIIMLSVICVAVDAIVHLMRWRSYKVWFSFLRRLRGHKDDPEDTGSFSGRMRREWHYADGTARTEEVAVEMPAQQWYPEELPASRISSAEMDQDYVQSFAKPEKLKYQQEMKKDQPVGLEDYPQPSGTAEEPRRRTSRSERLHKRVARLNTYLDGDDELELRYRPAPPPVDKRDAYHEPFIPPQWKRPADHGAANEEETHDHAF